MGGCVTQLTITHYYIFFIAAIQLEFVCYFANYKMVMLVGF